MIDIYSRYLVGVHVHAHESGIEQYAERMSSSSNSTYCWQAHGEPHGDSAQSAAHAARGRARGALRRDIARASRPRRAGEIRRRRRRAWWPSCSPARSATRRRRWCSRSAATAGGISACIRTSTCSCSSAARWTPSDEGAARKNCSIRCGISGSAVGHQVRELKDFARIEADNPEFLLALVDARPIAGDRDLFDRFMTRVSARRAPRARRRRAGGADRRAARALQRHLLSARARRQRRAGRPARSGRGARDRAADRSGAAPARGRRIPRGSTRRRSSCCATRSILHLDEQAEPERVEPRDAGEGGGAARLSGRAAAGARRAADGRLLPSCPRRREVAGVDSPRRAGAGRAQPGEVGRRHPLHRCRRRGRDQPDTWLSAFQAAIDSGAAVSDDTLSCIQQHADRFTERRFLSRPGPPGRVARVPEAAPRPVRAAVADARQRAARRASCPSSARSPAAWCATSTTSTRSTSTRSWRSGRSSASPRRCCREPRRASASGSPRCCRISNVPSCWCSRCCCTTSASRATRSTSRKASAWPAASSSAWRCPPMRARWSSFSSPTTSRCRPSRSAATPRIRRRCGGSRRWSASKSG